MQKKKKILIVVESMRINTTSSGITSSTFLTLLFESGYEITIITQNNFYYPITWLDDSIKIKKFDLPLVRKRFIDKIPKLRAFPTYISGFNRSFRALIDQWKIEINCELKKSQYNAIYALGSGSEFSTHFALAEMILDIPFYVNIHDPYPWHLYPVPYKKPKNYINSILEKKFKRILDNAKGISFPSKLLMEDMAKTFPIIKRTGFVIPHIGVKLDNLPSSPEDQNVILNKEKINIVHAGSLLGPRNPSFLIAAILELQEEHTWIKTVVDFVFIGKIANDLKSIVQKNNVSNIFFLDVRVSYKKSIEIMEQSNALFVIEAISDFSPFLPSKVADIAFQNKTIIALSPANSEVRRLLTSQYKYQSTLNDVFSIKNIIYEFVLDQKQNKIESVPFLQKYVSIEYNKKIIQEIL